MHTHFIASVLNSDKSKLHSSFNIFLVAEYSSFVHRIIRNPQPKSLSDPRQKRSAEILVVASSFVETDLCNSTDIFDPVKALPSSRSITRERKREREREKGRRRGREILRGTSQFCITHERCPCRAENDYSFRLSFN